MFCMLVILNRSSSASLLEGFSGGDVMEVVVVVRGKGKECWRVRDLDG